MPFQRLLDRIRAFPGVEACAFLDSEGELILHSGGADPERMRAVGAYQGILLATARRLESLEVRTICARYRNRSVLTRALKDGYFISVIFTPNLNFAYAQFVFEEIYRELDAGL